MMDLLHDTGIWLLASFVIFCFVLWQKGKSAIAKLLDARIQDIRQEIETAESLRVESQELLAQYQRKHRDAVQDAEKIIADAKSHAKRIREKADQDLTDLIGRREEQLQVRLKRMEDEAVSEIKAYAADLAVKAAKEIVAEGMKKKEANDLIDDSIRRVSSAL